MKIIKKITAIIVILLIITLPLVFAADQAVSRYTAEGELFSQRTAGLGEFIIINVANYEPSQIRQAMLEQQNVPVFVYLKGTTLGTVLSPISDDPKERDPLYGITNIPPIKYITITPINLSMDYIASYRYVSPTRNAYSLSNLGYLIINVKKQQNISSLPERESLGLTTRVIDLAMQARILFDFEKGSLLGISQQERVLEAIPEDKDFFSRELSPYAILGGRAYLRATDISANTATFMVYDKSRNPISLISPALGSTEQGIQPMTALIRLTAGQTSNIISLGLSGDPFTDNFKIKLNKIVTPQSTATLKIMAAGQIFTKTARVNEKISDGSSWIVSEIADKTEQPPKATKADLIALKVDATTLKVSPDDLYIDFNKVTLKNTQTGITKTLITKRLISGVGYITTKEQLKDEAVDVLEKAYCPSTNPEPACRAIEGFKKVIKEYPSSKDSAEAYVYLGDIFNNELIIKNKPCDTSSKSYNKEICAAYKRDMRNLANYYYQKVIQLNPSRSSELEEKLYEQSYADEQFEYLPDDDTTVFLVSSKPISEKAKGYATIKIADYPEKNYYKGDLLVDDKGNKIQGYTEDGRPCYLIVSSIDSTRVVIQQISTSQKLTEKIKSYVGLYSKGLLLAQDELLDFFPTLASQKENKPSQLRMKVTKIEAKNEVYITILPGLTEAAVYSNFSVHIPIEQRPFSYTSDELKGKINSTREIIQKLDTVIENLDSVVRAWKRTCIVTFALLTVKNSFLQGTSRNLARKEVSSFFKQKCAQDVAAKKYDTNIECYSANSDEMNKAIDANQNAINNVQAQLKGKSLDDLEKVPDFKNFELVGGTMEQYRNHLRYHSMKEQFSNATDFGKYIQKKYDDIGYQKKIKIYNEAKAFAEANKIPGADEQSLIAGFISLKEQGAPVDVKTTKINFIEELTTQDQIKEGKPQEFLSVVSEAGKEKSIKLRRLNQLQYQIYNDGYEKFIAAIKNDCAKQYTVGQTSPSKDSVKICMQQRINQLENTAANDKGSEVYVESYKVRTHQIPEAGIQKELIATEENNLYQAKGVSVPITFYTSTVKGFAGDKLISTQYTTNKQNSIIAQYDNNGNAYCYPVGKGEYVQVLERYSTGPPKTIRVLNVGPDGRIDCGAGDDVFLYDEAYFKIKENTAKRNNYISKINKAPKCNKEGDVVGSSDGKKVICSMNSYLTQSSLETTECIDTMDPTDCRVLFNACDPVMCPATRCNLAGRYTPKGGVIRTGLIGSVVLCAPNFPEVVVPFCLTGILSGLKGIRSILQGYADCLEANLKDGSNVGFCDYINSLGICEILWRETMFLLDMKGGVLNWLSGKIFGEEKGGAEYLTFQSALDNLGQSVEAFTKEYSDTRIAALYQGKSTQEFGTEVCRRAINAKFPSIGDILDQLSEPEDPPQFYAFFDTAPYVTDAGSVAGAAASGAYGAKELVAYTVFYHIYAGTGYPAEQTALTAQPLGEASTGPIRYAVYLRNKQTNKILYVTSNPQEFALPEKTIARGSYAQQTIHAVSEPGFTEICVVISGREDCGFKKVSSDFAVKYTQDVLVEDEAKRTDIKSYKECTPEFSRTSPTLGSIPTPVDLGLLSTGTARVCNLEPPTAELDRWFEVGSCGKDDKGLDLGKCWLDKNSINIEDKKRKEDVIKGLKATKLSAEEQNKLITESDSKEALLRLNEIRNELIEQIKQLYEDAKKQKQQ